MTQKTNPLSFPSLEIIHRNPCFKLAWCGRTRYKPVKLGMNSNLLSMFLYKLKCKILFPTFFVFWYKFKFNMLKQSSTPSPLLLSGLVDGLSPVYCQKTFCCATNNIFSSENFFTFDIGIKCTRQNKQHIMPEYLFI